MLEMCFVNSSAKEKKWIVFILMLWLVPTLEEGSVATIVKQWWANKITTDP